MIRGSSGYCRPRARPRIPAGGDQGLIHADNGEIQFNNSMHLTNTSSVAATNGGTISFAA